MTDVSIIIPTYNRESRVINAIDSCLNNDLYLEVLVVDDGSNDDTKQTILKTFGNWQQTVNNNGFNLTNINKTIRYIAQANSGAPAARNNGLKHANGSYIKFLDSDDLLIEGALAQEFSLAEKQHCDALLTGWLLRTVDDQGTVISEQTVEAPDLSNGIDDMLEGKGPCASAGFYRRLKISHLFWDETINKAQDWMWAWTVCLDGVKFSSLTIPSSIYVQHQSDHRITQQGNSYLRSTLARLNILSKVENIMNRKDLLTEARAQKLAHYYYKDARVLCEIDEGKWLNLCQKIQALDPLFSPDESKWFVRSLIRVFGLKKAVIYFVRLKKIIKR